ncbi:penicillin-binding transpeptidase domain-containing protein [Psychrobacillus sp. FJAT-21963]|uniref:penicillin-binding transpeptidase domain-containing protein n=1 Tax=Psychrobacillus sp. FJAT-21963 TaxID=1712028 RepID=UPI0006F4F7B7|nr:penicillin-binding transpeptidase domain-containing protein [Psychrobacillus sp. FJAT-21963]KQL36555.1 penicillin-binding protein [Psychrobacillus sp. FJAT-21963]
MNKKFRFQWGAFLMFLLYGGLFFLLLSRFVFIQVTGTAEGQVLSTKADSKYSREQVIPASRGKIVDRNGDIIVEDTLSYKIIAVISPEATNNSSAPRHVVDPEKTAKVLAEYIDMPEQDILDVLNKYIKAGKYQVEFGKAGRDISYKVMTEIKNNNLPGIIFVQDMKRLYPNGQFASHLIGFALKEENEDGEAVAVGKMGLEYIYDEELTGTPGKVNFKSDTKGFLLPNAEKMITNPKDGDNIHLTIDKTIQNFLEDALNKAEEKYNPEKMTAIVANPKTGEILAMSQRPTFEPNTREGLSTNWLNEAIEQTIEPGSTMKIFTLASAIEEGVWEPNATYKSGSYTVYDRTIRDHNVYGWGTISYLEGFQRSSNVSMAYLLNRIGDETFIDYIHRFGFGEKTGIDLPHEATGTVSDKYPINRVTTTYGQGTTVTPIQLVQAMTAIANKGKMMQPYVIDKIVDPSTGKLVSDHKPVEKESPISEKTAEQVKEILASTVTSEKGTAQRFKLDDYTTAGKTGTAQIANPEGGYFWGRNLFLYSFLGLAPVEDPQLIVYVAVHKPQLKDTEVGSEPTSDIFNSVTENSLKYLNIQPENLELASSIKMPNIVGQNMMESQTTLESQGLKTVIIGQSENVKEQFPAAGTSILAKGTVFIKGEGDIELPNFTGWSKRNIMIYKSLSNIPIEISGEGYVTSQSLTAGSIVSKDTPVVVHLSTPEETKIVPELEESMEEPPQD